MRSCDERYVVSKISKMKPFPEIRFQVPPLIISGNKVAPQEYGTLDHMPVLAQLRAIRERPRRHTDDCDKDR